MKDTTIQDRLHKKLNDITNLLKSLNEKCFLLQDPAIVNEIHNALKTFEITKLDDDKYKALNLILDIIDKITILEKENEDIHQLIHDISSGLKQIRKEIYFAQHLSATLEKEGIRSLSEARKLADLVSSLGKLCVNLNDRVEKQNLAVLETYNKIIQSAATTPSMFNTGNKLADILKKFIDTEKVESQLIEKKTPSLHRKR